MAPCDIIRPRDAAGLVLLRARGDSLEVMLGRRHGRARFMPGVFVTPGGCLDSGDSDGSGFPERLPPCQPGLDRRTERRIAAFARCALRETLEETGLLVGPQAADAKPDSSAAPWAAYAALGRRPAFEALHIFARAITPAASPIRFHTRFFLAWDAPVTVAASGDGELEAVDWVPWNALEALPMSEVTRAILEAARIYREGIREGDPPAVERMIYRDGRRLFTRGYG